MKTNNIIKRIKVAAVGLSTILAPLTLGGVGGGLLTACQDRDLPGSGEMQVPSPDVTTINGTPSGDNNYDYTLT